jgi:hypothetical protein
MPGAYGVCQYQSEPRRHEDSRDRITPSPVVVGRASADYSHVSAEVHVPNWQTTYPGIAGMYMWVLEKHPSKTFCRKTGGQPLSTAMIKIGEGAAARDHLQ